MPPANLLRPAQQKHRRQHRWDMVTSVRTIRPTCRP
jgi:hypothetical protein